MSTFKVWITIERHNDRTDEYEDIDPGFGGTAEFKTLAKAQAFADKLNAIGEVIADEKQGGAK